MSTKGSPLKTVSMAPPCGQFGSQQCGDHNSESPDTIHDMPLAKTVTGVFNPYNQYIIYLD